MLTSHSGADQWLHAVHLWNHVDVSAIELARTCFRATEIDDTVLTAFFSTQFSDRLTMLPVNFFSNTTHLQVPAEFLLSIHTPCIGIVVPVGGNDDGFGANHYVLCVLDRDFEECRLYNSLPGYNDIATATFVLSWLCYPHYAIFTGISRMQSTNDCGLWVVRNAIFEMVGRRSKIMRTDIVMSVCYSTTICFSSLPSSQDVQDFDAKITLRRAEARADVDSSKDK